MSFFIPFLQFSPKEAAVVARKSLYFKFRHTCHCNFPTDLVIFVDKYILELAQQVTRPITLSETPELDRMLGNVRLKIRRDATICKLLAQDYHVDLGARILRTAVKGTVEELLVEEYLGVGEEIRETEEFLEFWVDEEGGEVFGGMVKKNGKSDGGQSE